jgi:hypothetical protein
MLKDQPLPRPKKGGPTELFEWLLNAAEILSGSKYKSNLNDSKSGTYDEGIQVPDKTSY